MVEGGERGKRGREQQKKEGRRGRGKGIMNIKMEIDLTLNMKALIGNCDKVLFYLPLPV